MTGNIHIFLISNYFIKLLCPIRNLPLQAHYHAKTLPTSDPISLMPPNFTRVHFRNHALNIKAGYSFSQTTDESQVVPPTPFEHQRDNFQLATSKVPRSSWINCYIFSWFARNRVCFDSWFGFWAWKRDRQSIIEHRQTTYDTATQQRGRTWDISRHWPPSPALAWFVI